MTDNCANPDYNAKYQKKGYKKKERQFQPINNNSDVTHIYYDITIKNNNTGYDGSGNITNKQAPVLCSFNQNRQNPYLNNAEEYDVSVPYFSLDCTSLPLQVVQPRLGVRNVGPATSGSYTINGIPTVYGGYLTKSGVAYFFQVYWRPEDSTLVSPATSTNTTTAMFSNPYFYNYSYEYFLNLLNSVIGYTMINNAFISASVPSFSYNPVTQLFSFNARYNEWNNTAQTNPFNTSAYNIYLNEQLYSLLGGLQSEYTTVPGTTGVVAKQYFYHLLNIVDNAYSNVYSSGGNITTVPLTPSYNYIVSTQCYQTIELWNPIIAIVFIARNLSIININVGTPSIIGPNPNPQTNASQVSNTLFEIGISNRADPKFYYNPTGQYILTNLLGITEVQDLYIDIFWKDSFGNLYPITLAEQAAMVIKLLFRKKDFNY